MSDDKNGAGAAPQNGGTAERSDEGGSPEQRLAAAEAELADAKDRQLRALAEVENVRRRAQRDLTDAQRYGASSFAKDLLNVADNLRRALASLPEEQVQDEAVRNLLVGVEATERELLGAFERHGLRRIEPQPGERFDHNVHQAMFEVENTAQPPGSVVQVLQPGYVMHDRLLRPAMVGVAKAEARPQEPQNAGTAS
jgi:molecular chaperone GrpE